MTWDAPYADYRVLRGPAAKFFCLAVDDLLDLIGGDWLLGISLEHCETYESLNKAFPRTPEAQLGAVQAVVLALTQDGPEPESSAWSEATVAEIVDSSIATLELEQEYEKGVPRTLTKVYKQLVKQMRDPDDPDDREAWLDFPEHLERFKNRLLWDADYDLANVPDSSPEVGTFVKLQLGIDRDYFSSAAPEVPEIVPAIVAIRKLLQVALRRKA